jgi:3,4-dihydroxy 2-butanone 4-phosphate synthase/GTP cyclohydrolase II
MEPIERALARIQSAHQARERPSVTLTYAQSLDGSISAVRGRPLTLSGPDSARMTHQLRAAHDAILVGIGTVLSDDPRLDVRLVEGRNPRPVVLDSQLRMPTGANLLKGLSVSSRIPLIVTTERAPENRVVALEAAGAQVHRLPAGEGGRVPIPAMLPYLRSQGVASLMVEGGAQVITSFLRLRLVDFFVLTIAPILLGGLRAVEDLSNGETGSTTRAFPRFKAGDWIRLGDDLVLWGQPAWTE